jgi:hypothetical protein
VQGSLAFYSGAFYVTQVSPSSATYANISGTASLAGTVLATFATGSYVTKDYLILQSAGLNGTTFGALDTLGLPAGFVASLDYTHTDDVYLDLQARLSGTTGLNGNQQNVANTLNTFFNGGGALPANFVNVFGLTGGALNNALTQIDGEDATGAEHSAFELTNQFLKRWRRSGVGFCTRCRGEPAA